MIIYIILFISCIIFFVYYYYSNIDNDKFDDRWDTAIYLGCIKPTWQDDVEQIENLAQPMSWKDIKLSKNSDG